MQRSIRPLSRAILGLSAIAGFAMWRSATGLVKRVESKVLTHSVIVNKSISEVQQALGGGSAQATGLNTADVTLEAIDPSLTKLTAKTDAAAGDLRRIKALIETGELATVKGQSHGQRSVVGKTIGKVIQAPSLPRAPAAQEAHA